MGKIKEMTFVAAQRSIFRDEDLLFYHSVVGNDLREP